MCWRASAAAGVPLCAVSGIRPESGVEARITTRGWGNQQAGCTAAARREVGLLDAPVRMTTQIDRRCRRVLTVMSTTMTGGVEKS